MSDERLECVCRKGLKYLNYEPDGCEYCKGATGSGKGSCIDLTTVTTGGFDLKLLTKSMKKGQAYINIHSLANLGGELRGQIIPVKGK